MRDGGPRLQCAQRAAALGLYIKALLLRTGELHDFEESLLVNYLVDFSGLVF